MTNNVTNPTPVLFDDQLRQVLAFIYEKTSDSNGINWISSLDIQNGLLAEYSLHVHWRTIDKILSENKGLVRGKWRGKRREYTLLADGKKLVARPESAVVLVDPARAVEAVVSLHDTLSSLKGEIRVCDPYLNEATIEHLSACSTPVTILLLTSKVRDTAKLRRLLAAAKMAGQDIEVRRDAHGKIHDRYVIDDHTMLMLGTSLNGFGNKQHFVTRCGNDIRSITLSHFNARWANASQWP